jgi:hypothetical protein
LFVRVQREDGTLEPPELLDVFDEPGTGDYVWLAGARRVEVRGAERESDGRLRYLIAVDRPTPDDTRRGERGVLSTKFQSSLGVHVEVTAEAAELIVERGGKLFLWQDSVGGAWLRDRVAFNDPGAGTRFHRIPAGLVSLMLAEDIALPRRLGIDVGRLPPRRVHVDWHGLTWGQRGAGE